MGMIEFSRPDGGKTKGYLAMAGQGRPGIVVIQEWWGLNDQICGVADRFARAGYNALARPTRFTATTRRTPFSTSAAPPTTWPAPIRPGTVCSVFSNGGCNRYRSPTLWDWESRIGWIGAAHPQADGRFRQSLCRSA